MMVTYRTAQQLYYEAEALYHRACQSWRDIQGWPPEGPFGPRGGSVYDFVMRAQVALEQTAWIHRDIKRLMNLQIPSLS